MPEVSEQFVKHATALAHSHKEGVEKIAAVVIDQGQRELVADTLIERGLVPANQKQAAVQSLGDHKETLVLLNKTAQRVEAESMGKPASLETKTASDGVGSQSEADRAFLAGLNL